MTSDGIRSGVNCTRRKSRSSAAASVFTRSVLATPGTPSRRTWPRTSNAATRPDSVPSWPTTTLAISSRTATTAARGSARLAGATGDLLAGDLDRLGEPNQVGVGGHGFVRQHVHQPFIVGTS